MIILPMIAHEVLETINAHGDEAYIVGGCVRDALLKRDTNDIDVATNATLESLIELFADYRPEVFASFGNIRFNTQGYQFAITRWRKETAYEDGRHPNTVDYSATLKEDAQRRDFTINALYYHPDQGIIDFFDGVSDINNKILRTIGDSNQRFSQDYLRCLRLMRFGAQLGFAIDEKTEQAWFNHCDKLRSLSLSTTFDEFTKLLVAPHFLGVVMKYPKVLSTIIKELDDAHHFDQNNPYHQFTLYEHSVRVASQLNGRLMRLAALFHDLGKMKTLTIAEDGRYRYPGHAKASCEIMAPYLKSWQLKKQECEYLEKLVLNHDLSLPEELKAFKLIVSQFGVPFMEDLIVFKREDNRAKSDLAQYQILKCDHYQSMLNDLVSNNELININTLQIRGQDLIRLGVSEEKRSKVLRYLLESVLEERIINSNEVLVNEVERIMNDDIY